MFSHPAFSSTQLFGILNLSKTAIAIYTTDQLIIQMANDAMIDIYQGDRTVIGKTLVDAVPELVGQPFITLLKKVWQTGQTYQAKDALRKIMVDSVLTDFYFDINYEAIKNEEGEMIAILSTAVDSTAQHYTNERLSCLEEERQTIDDKLNDSELRLQGILDTMAEGVGIVDRSGKLIYANRMAQQILGLEESKIKERTYYDPQWKNLRLDGSPLPQEEHPMNIMMTTGQSVYDHEIGVQPFNGDRLYISINAAPLFDAKGNIDGGIGTFMDVTSRRKDIQEKDSFISIASHELKTPLTSLKASIQMLDKIKNAPPPLLLPKIINNCLRSMDRINNLIEELLDITKLTQGNLELTETDLNVKHLLETCCNHVRIAGTHQLIVLGDERLTVLADENRIEQVLTNLVNNAVKYAPGSNKIILSFEAIHDHIKISVTDFGQGIEPAQIPHLFDRYYQVNKIGSTSKAGLGLGLFISAEIVRRHGGKIGVESQPREGSTFWFTLPSK